MILNMWHRLFGLTLLEPCTFTTHRGIILLALLPRKFTFEKSTEQWRSSIPAAIVVDI